MSDTNEEKKGLASRHWEVEYQSAEEGVDLLHDFYVPALSLAQSYDRVAGFFTSSSLASAAAGFAKFVEHGGKARFIVGAQLDAKDAEAIIKGEEARANEALLNELGDFENEPLEVCERLHNLCWLIANNRLELRVACKVDPKTGTPVPSVAGEGYFHMKFAIFHDEYGQRMAFTGSLNESKTALELNAENIDVYCDWKNPDFRELVDKKCRSFENYWHNRNREYRVVPLPEAVRHRLANLTEPLRKRCIKLAAQNPSTERLRLGIIKDAPLMPNGLYVGMETAPVDPWPHQREVAHQLVDQWPIGAMICDEVGLGKTIEAGLAIRSLVLSQRVKKVLILAPAGLCSQWQREMASKFNLPFARVFSTQQGYKKEYLYPEEKTFVSDSLLSENLTILSTGLFVRDKHFSALLAEASPDLVFVDEAHYARRQSPDQERPDHQYPTYGTLYRRLDQLAAKMKYQRMWLATATPMQLNWIEAWDLLRLIKGSGWYNDDPTLMKNYYSALDAFAGKNENIWQRRLLGNTKAYFEKAKDCRFEGLASVEQKETEKMRDGKKPFTPKRKTLMKAFFSVAPLSSVMIRHTRELLKHYKQAGLLSAGLAERTIADSPSLKMTLQEQEVAKGLADYCAQLPQHMGEHLSESQRSSIGFFLSFLQVRFASSTFALKETLRRRLEKLGGKGMPALDPDVSDYDDFEDDEPEENNKLESWTLERSDDDLQWERSQLRNLLAKVEREEETWAQQSPAKLLHLYTVLEKRRIGNSDRFQQLVLFTRFFDTLYSIRTQLSSRIPRLRLGVYSGMECSWSDGKQVFRVDRDEVKRRFCAGEIDILLCTDAAAEGLNLQTADLLINYDLPWNPMKLEQRIGRIDRIGQKYDKITVLNLYYEGSVEEQIYNKLTVRLENAWGVVGTQRPSLLPIRQEDFSRLASGQMTIEDLEKQAGEEIERMRKFRAALEPQPDELMEQYQKHCEQWAQKPIPSTLEGAWATLTNGLTAKDNDWRCEDDGLLRNDGKADVLMTIDKRRYDLGEQGRSIVFASYGCPSFDMLLKQGTRSELPPWCCRLEVEKDATKMVAYGVATSSGPRLITSLGQLDQVGKINYKADLSDADKRWLRQELEGLLLADLANFKNAEDSLRHSREAEIAQANLNLFVASGLLDTFSRFESKGAAASRPIGDVVKWLDSKNALIDGEGLGDQPYNLVRPSGVESAAIAGASFVNTGNDKFFAATPDVIDSALSLTLRLLSRSRGHKSSQSVQSAESALERRKSELRHF